MSGEQQIIDGLLDQLEQAAAADSKVNQLTHCSPGSILSDIVQHSRAVQG